MKDKTKMRLSGLALLVVSIAAFAILLNAMIDVPIMETISFIFGIFCFFGIAFAFLAGAVFLITGDKWNERNNKK